MNLNEFGCFFNEIFLLIDLTFWIPNFFLAKKIKRGIDEVDTPEKPIN